MLGTRRILGGSLFTSRAGRSAGRAILIAALLGLAGCRVNSDDRAGSASNFGTDIVTTDPMPASSQVELPTTTVAGARYVLSVGDLVVRVGPTPGLASAAQPVV